MRTANERIEELEERMELVERRQVAALSAAYEAIDAALQSLRDNRAIQTIHHKLVMEEVRRRLDQSLSGYPDLLDQLHRGYWPRRFQGE